MTPISFYHTHISDKSTNLIEQVLESTFISEGDIVLQFEKELHETLGLINPVTVNSGTAALHLSLLVAGIGEGDEVILPAQTFVATGLAILMSGATPVFADIQYETGNIDPESVRSKITTNTKAIIPVHWAGYPCDLDELQIIANEFDLVVIEDAAHALGGEYHGRTVGTISDFTCFSFQAIKHLTTGDGGAICCKTAENRQKAKNLRWFGIERDASSVSELGEREYDIKNVGYKYHLNNLAAALGLANMKDIGYIIERRKEIADFYRKELCNVQGITLFDKKSDRRSANWQFGFHVSNRSGFIHSMKKSNIPVSVVHLGIDKNSVFGGLKKELVKQRKFDQSQIHIPIHSGLKNEQIEFITKTIKKGW